MSDRKKRGKTRERKEDGAKIEIITKRRERKKKTQNIKKERNNNPREEGLA